VNQAGRERKTGSDGLVALNPIPKIQADGARRIKCARFFLDDRFSFT
jgi:hypothetical protein